MTVREQLATRAHVDTIKGRARITLVGEGGGERELLLSDEAAWQIVHGLVVHLRMTTRPSAAGNARPKGCRDCSASVYGVVSGGGGDD